MNIRIVCDEARQTVLFAARELKAYLGRINPLLHISVLENEGCGPEDSDRTDGEIHLFVLSGMAEDVGKDPASDDIYDINIKELAGTIKGSNPRSVLLGVYQYLYRLGCRFLRPGKEYERIPSLSNRGDFTVSFRHEASNRHRGVCIEGADSLENICDFVDWLPKLGFNSFFVQFQIPYAFLARWYQHENNPLWKYTEDENVLKAFEIEQAEKMSEEIDGEMQKRGLLHHRVGHGWTSAVLGQSVLGWASAETELLEEYKAFPAMMNGKRELFGGIPSNTNLCYSNPEVIERFSRQITDYASEHPDVNYLHVWLADDCNNHCECEECSKNIPTDLYVNILNRIDRQLTEKKLDTKIVMLLYLDLLWPPSIELENPERFLLMFAPISRTFTHSYKDRAAIPAFPEYKRNKIKLPVGLEPNLSYLEGWKKCFKGETFVYDYHLGRAHYGDWGYINISHILYEDIRTLKELGLNGYVGCQELRAFLPNGLPNYVMGMALLDEGLSFEDIVDDYYKSAYGEQWKECLAYLTDLSDLCNCDYFNKKGDRIDAGIAENMKQVIKLLDDKKSCLDSQTEKASGVEKIFWDHLVYHQACTRLLAQAVYSLASDMQEEKDERWKLYKTFIRENERKYQESFDVYRIIEVAIHYTGFTGND